MSLKGRSEEARLKGHIERLQSRADWLDKRIRSGDSDKRDFTYDKAERSALLAAIELIEAVLSGELRRVQ